MSITPTQNHGVTNVIPTSRSGLVCVVASVSMVVEAAHVPHTHQERMVTVFVLINQCALYPLTPGVWYVLSI